MRPARSRLAVAGALGLLGVVFEVAAAHPEAPATARAPAPGRPAATAAYKDARRPLEERVGDLLGRMTVEEKAAQLQGVWRRKAGFTDAQGRFVPAQAGPALGQGIGQITRPSEKHTPIEAATYVDAIQKYLRDETRLGIPALVHEEALHGLVAPGATSFPQALALASTWDPELLTRIFDAAARQTRARGVHQVLAPVVDVARDPRWGRTEETYGEDPYLVTRLGVAAIRGLQGGAPVPDRAHVIATGKHFASHGEPLGGRNTAPGNLSARMLRQVVLPSFEAAVREAGVGSLMPSYNELDGVPSHANGWLLGDVLRREWGFPGFLVSDYFGIAMLDKTHRVTADRAASAVLALEAGVDIELPDPDAYALLPALVREGRVPVALLDRSVARVLRAKLALGLFEDPSVDTAALAAASPAAAAEAGALALRAAREAVTLLKNDRGLLPLDRARLHRVAVVGPNAAACRLGGYSDAPGRCVSVLDGLRERLGAGVTVTHAEGCAITIGGRGWDDDEVALAEPAREKEGVAAAARIARGADAVVVVLGQNEQVSREAWADKHLGDRDSLELVGSQLALLDAILAAGRPTILVLLDGSPVTLGGREAKVSAILHAFYLGQEGGLAVADVLLGDADPGGRLPITFPRNVGQIPAYYGQKPSALRPYLFGGQGPLWPFGFGLSFTTFTFDPPRVSPARLRPDGHARVEVTVHNGGRRRGDTVVQLYLRDDVSSVTRPIKELAGFERVTLDPGRSKTVSFDLGPAALGLWVTPERRIVEPGTFTVMVGGSSRDEDLKTATFEVLP